MVVFDTNVLIWGVKRQSTSGQENMIELAVRLIEDLDDKETEIALPSLVISEYLSNFPDESREEQYSELIRSYYIVPFDAKAASIAAKIRNDRDKISGIVDEYSASRNVIKADIYILASALSCGATEIFTHDKHIKKLAKGFDILVSDIPMLPPRKTQKSLLD